MRVYGQGKGQGHVEVYGLGLVYGYGHVQGNGHRHVQGNGLPVSRIRAAPVVWRGSTAGGIFPPDN